MSSPRMTKPTQLILDELLSDPTAEKYGLEICKAVGYRSGTVYPLLYKFEHLGWLKSRWEEINPSSAGRPLRRYYQLTPEGIERALRALKRPVEAKRRLQINPEPLRLVPPEYRWMSGLGHISRETSRRAWVALGGDPAVWDEEHPLP